MDNQNIFRRLDACFSNLAQALIRAGLRSADPVVIEPIKEAISHTAQAAALVRNLQSAPVTPHKKASLLWLSHHGFDSVIQQTIKGEKQLPILPEEE